MSLSIRHWLAERHIDLSQLGHPNAQIAGIAFRLAQDMEVKSLNVFAVSALTDVLELPFKAAWQATPGISQLSVGLLRILSRKKPLKRNEGTWLTFQVAYLNALQGILEQEARIGRPWMNRAEVPVGQDADEPLDDSPLVALLKTLRPGRLSDSQAEQALTLVADSFLVQQINSVAIAWFVANGAEETEARLLVQRLSNGLPGHLLSVITESPLPLAQLQKFVRLGNLSGWRDTSTQENAALQAEPTTATLPLNLHQEYYRAGLLQSLSEPLLTEPFSLKDLYVPLKGKSYELGERFSLQNSELGTQNTQNPLVDLMEWAMSQLDDKTSIAIIEAEPGSGKTSFCKIWAAKVARELYPSWMPVVISLSHATLGQTLEQTLESAFPIGRFTDTDGWLSLNSPPCLLILDGLDELPQAPHRSNHLWAFVDQLLRFHRQNISPSGLPRHKLVLTSRFGTLDCFTRNYRQSSTLGPLRLSSLLRRIAIAPMGQDEFRQWFQHWARLQSKAIAQAYFSFLKHGGVFQQRPNATNLAPLVKRPLLLYLVGILHRDGLLDESIFQLSSPQLLFEIYDRITRWLLGEPAASQSPLPELTREGLAHATRSQEAIANLLAGRSPQQLRYQMQLVALTLVQTGHAQVPQATIQNRLTREPTSAPLTQSLPAFFFRSRPPHAILDFRVPSLDWTEPDNNRETARLTQQSIIPNPKSTIQNSLIEFSHRSLGEYLGAEEIAIQLIALTRHVQNRYSEVSFVIQD
ncbi:MAG: NACHT domain-containing protein, partial [Coleofasciculus sp. S288]|nr:NACHT domain-containing protein [Coleofasciculus sp. S288]